MFSVTFNKQLFARLDSKENAVKLGLAVHSSSNAPHRIVVSAPDGNEVITFDLIVKSDV